MVRSVLLLPIILMKLPHPMREEEVKTLVQANRSLKERGVLKNRILLVDDDQSVRETISEILREAGYECLEVPDGESALRLVAQVAEPIHLIILDWFMPGLDGASTFRRLREHNPAVKAILMSGYQHSEEVKTLEAEGIKAFISKPFEIDNLIETIQQALSE